MHTPPLNLNKSTTACWSRWTLLWRYNIGSLPLCGLEDGLELAVPVHYLTWGSPQKLSIDEQHWGREPPGSPVHRSYYTVVLPSEHVTGKCYTLFAESRFVRAECNSLICVPECLVFLEEVSSTHFSFLGVPVIASSKRLEKASFAVQCSIGVCKYPHGVIKVVNFPLSSSKGIWWYPELAPATVLKVCFGTLLTVFNDEQIWWVSDGLAWLSLWKFTVFHTRPSVWTMQEHHTKPDILF